MCTSMYMYCRRVCILCCLSLEFIASVLFVPRRPSVVYIGSAGKSYAVHISNVHVQLRPVKSHPECIFCALDALEVARMQLDIHMYKYNDVNGTGPGHQLCTLGRISPSATVGQHGLCRRLHFIIQYSIECRNVGY